VELDALLGDAHLERVPHVIAALPRLGDTGKTLKRQNKKAKSDKCKVRGRQLKTTAEEMIANFVSSPNASGIP
jgi:hypothetical protein